MVFQKKISFFDRLKKKLFRIERSIFNYDTNGYFDKNDDWIKCKDDGTPLDSKPISIVKEEL